MNSLYNNEFHQRSIEGAGKSADIILPQIIKLIEPKSVIDVGCGLGAWLKVARRYGVSEVFGIDGGGIDTNQLLIDKKEYQEIDLNQPLKLKRKFDLAICLEVAEHLEKKNADIFIDTLTSLSGCILFSAAVVRQGGVLHKNEQWPEYWQRKFSERGFSFYDIRYQLLSNNDIEWWYRQNIFLVVRKGTHSELDQIPIYNPEFKLMHASVFRRYESPKEYAKFFIGRLFNLTRAN